MQIAQVPERNEPDSPGELNYCYLFDVLEKLGYKGYIGCEYKPLGKMAVLFPQTGGFTSSTDISVCFRQHYYGSALAEGLLDTEPSWSTGLSHWLWHHFSSGHHQWPSFVTTTRWSIITLNWCHIIRIFSPNWSI